MSQGARMDLRREKSPMHPPTETRDWCKPCRKGKHCCGACNCSICCSQETREMLEAMQ